MTRPHIFSIGEFYHLYNRGADKRPVFSSKSDYLRFIVLLYLCNNFGKSVHLSALKHLEFQDFFSLMREKPLVEIGAYCLMPNHFHILIKEIIENGISLFMQKLTTAYTMYFNKKSNRSGVLFQGVFQSRHIDVDEYLKYLFSYIHLNPVKLIDKNWKENGIADKKLAMKFLNDYEYSSYLDYCEGKRPQATILSKDGFPDYFQSPELFKGEIYDWLNYEDVFQGETLKDKVSP